VATPSVYHRQTTRRYEHAVAEDRRGCTHALRLAQSAVERSRADAGPAWAAYFSPAHFAGTAARCYRDLDLHRHALRHGRDGLALPAGNTRTRALHTALLATVPPTWTSPASTATRPPKTSMPYSHGVYGNASPS
jgi:hypothetical protein